MVLFGGLEVVAAGYLIHKHQKNKKEKERIEDERAYLEEEEEHRHRPSNHHRRRRSQSRRRHSHDRPHSHDGRYGRETSKPKPVPVPVPMPAAQSMHQAPPRYDTQPPPQQRPQDVKYGWNDNNPAPAPSQQQQTFPITGWPSHWEQSQRSGSTTHLAPQAPSSRAESSRGRSETRGPDSSPRVRFAVSTDERGRPRSISPPPKYRP